MYAITVVMMKDGKPKIGAGLTFSQRVGLAPLPSPLAFGELSPRLRNDLWTTVYLAMKRSRAGKDYAGELHPDDNGDCLIDPWLGICWRYDYKFRHIPVDELTTGYFTYEKRFKNLILTGEFSDVLDFVSFVLEDKSRPEGFATKISDVFQRNAAPYSVVDDKFIVPSVTLEEQNAVESALRQAERTGFDGAYEHLKKASICLEPSRGDYEGCARESIHAVESVLRKLDPRSSSSIETALKSLKVHMTIHPALEQGMKRLYGYSSDEEGIRHALIEPPSKIDMAEAVFMLGACASFVTYLITKAREVGLANVPPETK